jgi:hypothetical protein
MTLPRSINWFAIWIKVTLVIFAILRACDHSDTRAMITIFMRRKNGRPSPQSSLRSRGEADSSISKDVDVCGQTKMKSRPL